VILNITIKGTSYYTSLHEPISLALGFGPQAENPNAFFINPAEFNPIRVGNFVGSVAEGGSANCEVVTYCAHGNGTHTESIGHITSDRYPVFECMKDSNMTAQLLSVSLTTDGSGRFCVTAASFEGAEFHSVDALILRTMPNSEDKKTKIWSGNEPPYITVEAMELLVKAGFRHLLVDLPSVDPEEDGGALAAHRIWWNYPQNPRWNSSITELIYVPNAVADGLYFLQLVLPKIYSDAVPSNPLIYPLTLHV
jgi:arylformamidase